MHDKSLTLTGHGLAKRVLLASIQHALETKRQNIPLKFCINCVIVEIEQSQSWLESRLHLLVKVERRFCTIKNGLTKVIKLYHTTCIYYTGLSLQGVDRIWCQSTIFYLTSRLTCEGYLLVNYQKSIFVATLIYSYTHVTYILNISVTVYFISYTV